MHTLGKTAAALDGLDAERSTENQPTEAADLSGTKVFVRSRFFDTRHRFTIGSLHLGIPYRAESCHDKVSCQWQPSRESTWALQCTLLSMKTLLEPPHPKNKPVPACRRL